MSNWYPSSVGTWISLQQARAQVHGQVAWWECPGPHGELAACCQPRPDAPPDKPIWHNGSGKMYYGSWKQHPVKPNHWQWDGFGVYCRKDGRVFCGNWSDGKLSGLAKRVWLPAAPHWVRNRRESSIIQTQPKKKTNTNEQEEEEEPVGLPFMYLGYFRGNWKEDPRATVILKDGTTRIGPWERNEPVGDWWQDHEKAFTGPAKMKELLAFAMNTSKTTTTSVDPAALKLEHLFKQADNENTETATSDAVTNVDNTVSPAKSVTIDEHRDIYYEPEDPVMAARALPTNEQDTDESPNKLKLSQTTSTDMTEDETVMEDDDEEDEGDQLADLNMSKISVGTNDYSVHSKTTSILRNINAKALQHQQQHNLQQTGESQAASTQQQQQQTAPPLPTKAVAYDPQQLSMIAEWLTDEVMQYQASYEEMEYYAKNFLDVGLHSIALIQEMTTPADVASFSWMKDFHRRRFLAWVNQAARRNQEHWSRLISSIALWLGKKAIGFDADMLEMNMYAQNFVHLGFHSVPMIQQVCSHQDVQALTWMKPIHRRLLAQHLAQRRQQNMTTSSGTPTARRMASV